MLTVGCYEERDADIAAQTSRMLEEKGLKADMPTMQLLYSRLSPDSRLNQSEIDKLQIYLGERKNFSVEDVQKVISDVAGANYEDMCYLVASGNIQKSIAIFNRLLREGEEPVTLVRQLEYHFNKLLDCTAQLEEGVTMDNVIKSL